MILGKKKTVLDIPPKGAELSKGSGSDNNGDNKSDNAAKEDSDACIWGNKGNALVESSMYAEAIKCYDKAIEINPGSMEAWNNKGLALARTGRLAEAVQCYDKALLLNPGDMEVMYNKGIALSLLGKSAEAIECYDKLLAINPNDADAWCSRGDVLFESGRFEEALTDYDKSILIDPKDETAWNNRGMTLVKLNRFTEAIESYDKALELNPKVEKIWSNKGLAIAKLGENNNNNKIDLRKVAASLPKEDISALQATGTQPALPLKEEMDQVSVHVEPAERANTIPVNISAVNGNAPLNNQTEANEAEAAGGIPHQVQVDIQSSMSMPEPPVEKIAPINETRGQETARPANNELGNGVSTASEGNIGTDTVCDTGKTDPCTPACDTGKVPAAEIPQPGQVEIKPDKTGGAGNAVTGTAAQLNEIKAAPAVDAQVPAQMCSPSDKNTFESGQQDMVKSPVEVAVEGACQNPKPLNETTTPPAIPSPFPEHADMSSVRHELKPGPSIDKATDAGKCVVSVPVDACITAPFIGKHMQGRAEIDTGGQETGIGLTDERKSPDERTGKSEKIKKSEEYLVMGNTLYSLGKYEDAVDSYNKSLHIDPGNNTAWNNKGLALGRAGKVDEAIDCYDKALKLNPDDHIILNNKGSSLYKKGDIEGALQCYRSALELKPDSKTAKKGIKICTEYINNSRKTKRRE